MSAPLLAFECYIPDAPYPCPVCQSPVLFEGQACPQCCADRSSEMIAEACAALRIEPDGDESARWAAVLEAIRVNRAASEVLGWTVVDRNGNAFIPPLEFNPKISDRATAQAIAGALNRHPHETQTAGVPWGVAAAFISPSDRPAEAPEPAPGETDPALSKVGAGDWSAAPGGVKSETGQPADVADLMWPDLAPETRFVVRVYANAGSSDWPDVVGVSGPMPQTTDGLASLAVAVVALEDSRAGYYLIEAQPEGLDGPRGRLVAYENEVDRAARLAQEGNP